MTHYPHFRRLLIVLVAVCPIASAAGQVPDDEMLTFRVGEALREDPRVYVADIEISTDDGIVTLTGSVRSLMQKRYAGLIAKKLHGVRGVLNRIDVQTIVRPDVDILNDVGARVERNTASRIRRLNIAVEDGKVTLTGEAASYGFSAEAELAASDVPGVTSVVNRITIQPATVRPDAQIAEEIEQTYRRDVYLTGLPIGVTVNDGAVLLEGTVGNAYLRQRAADLAWNTSNVTDVVSNLQTSRLADRGERPAAVAPTDQQLIADVHAQLAHDPRVDASDVLVAVTDGHVTLRGNVPTVAQRQIAETDTQDVVGAVWVTNLLSVRTPLRPDEDIEEDVIRVLASDSALHGRRFDVQSIEGIVSLTGTVNTLYSKYHASQVAGRVRGVRAVHNQIEVRFTSVLRDKTLQGHIETRIRSNFETAWVAKRIAVTVDNGIAVLNGDVDTFAQRREVGRMAALTSGVRSVQNRVTIRGVAYPWEEWNNDGDSMRPSSEWLWEYRGDFSESPGVVRS